MKLTKKHDEFARKCLTDIGMAREFLQTYLPSIVKDKCDFNKLSIESGSYIEDDLKKHASDILYKVGLIDSENSYAYVYCLIEHQSSPDDLMSYRILCYQMAIIQRHMEKHPKDKLPLVIPIVFYNGTDTPYPYSTKLADLFADKDLFNQIGLGDFKLADLTVIEDSEIEQHKKLAFVEILLKHIRDKNLTAMIRVFQIAELYEINPSLVQSAIYYILSGKTRKEVIKLTEELKHNIPKYGDTFMNYAEELRKEGRQEGIQLGEQKVQQTQQEIAKNLLKSGVDSSIIAAATHLTLEQIKSLK